MFDENKLLNDIKNIEKLTEKISPPQQNQPQNQNQPQPQPQNQSMIESYKPKFFKNNPVIFDILVCVFVLCTIHIALYISDIDYIKRYHLSDETKLYEQTIDHSIIIIIDLLVIVSFFALKNFVNFV